MVGKALTVVGVAFLLVPAARGGGGPVPIPADGSSVGVATVSLSSRSPGAQPVLLTVKLHAELQCGRIAARALTVRLPGAMRVPRALVRSAVRVGGAVPAAVTTSGSTVRITIDTLKPLRAKCDVLGPGAFPVVFTSSAGLRNPARPGTYAVTVTGVPGGAWRGAVRIL